jgi:hypothetical protein
MWLLFEHYFPISILFELLSCVCANVASLPPRKQVARLDSQVLRYKTAADTSEKSEEELKTEKRKLQREVSSSLQLPFFTSSTLIFASGTFSTNLLGEKACQVAGIFPLSFLHLTLWLMSRWCTRNSRLELLSSESKHSRQIIGRWRSKSIDSRTNQRHRDSGS